MVCLGPFVWRPSLRTCRAARRPPGDFGGIPSRTAVLPATLHVMSWRTCDSATYEIPPARLTAMESPARVHLEHQAHGLSGGLTAGSALFSRSGGSRACLGPIPSLGARGTPRIWADTRLLTP